MIFVKLVIPIGDLALYIHIPFCRKRCRYCDFASSTGQEHLIPEYRKAVIQEFQQQRHLWEDSRITSIFFGGGTPSLWPAEELGGILKALLDSGHVDEGAEISLEANPGTVDREKLGMLHQAGFNRISFGVQSGNDRLLTAIGRIHTRADAERSIHAAYLSGFDNLNLDLMFGLPGQVMEDWEETLNWAISFRPKHLSCYGLQLEEGTELAKDVTRGLLKLPSEEVVADMMEYVMDFLPSRGFGQYEISNYSREGYACRHNLSYWKRQDYLGIGAGAVSTIGAQRWSNTETIQAYLRGVEDSGRSPCEVEELTVDQMMAESIMLGLRLIQGFDKEAFRERYGRSVEMAIGQDLLASLIQGGWLVDEAGFLRLSRKAVMVGNEIIGRCCARLLE